MASTAAERDPDGLALRRALDILDGRPPGRSRKAPTGKARQPTPARRPDLKKRQAVEFELRQIAEQAATVYPDLDPALVKAREQRDNAVEKVKRAANAVQAAEQALRLLDDAAFIELFGREDTDEWGDPNAPLGRRDYEDFTQALHNMATRLTKARDHAMRQLGSLEPRRRDAIDAVAALPDRGGRPKSAWDRWLVMRLCALVARYGLQDLIRETPNGSLHVVANCVCTMAGIPREVSNFGLRIGVRDWLINYAENPK